MDAIHIRALRHSAFYSPLLLTMSGGFLQQEGLTPVYDVATPDKTVEGGLLSGEIHLAQSAVAAGFAGLEQGTPSPVRHFAQINERDGFFLTRRGEQTDRIRMGRTCRPGGSGRSPLPTNRND